MDKVFVIIITYNGMEWYKRCFSSLRASTIPVSIIVVDNASSDGSAEYIRSEFPEILLIESKDNLGFGKGNNLALKYALDNGGDYVFLLNQDTWLVDSNVIEELIRIHKENPQFGILSPMHLRSDEKELWMLWENGNNDCSSRLVSDLYCNTMRDVYETNYVNAAAWLLPRKTIECVGGFDPLFQHYEEDDDYLNRTSFHGFKIGICPSVRIVHDHQKELKNPFNGFSRYHREQQLLVDLLNVNRPNSVNQYVRYLIRKCSSSLLSGNIKVFKQFYQDLSYVLNKKRCILQHKEINSRPGTSWLM